MVFIQLHGYILAHVIAYVMLIEFSVGSNFSSDNESLLTAVLWRGAGADPGFERRAWESGTYWCYDLGKYINIYSGRRHPV